LGQFRNCFLQERTAEHFDNYCRGLLSGIAAQSVEPIALASGTAVRTLQLFLVTAQWDHDKPATAISGGWAEPWRNAARPARCGGRHRRNQCLKKGEANTWRTTAVLGLRRQDRQRHRDPYTSASLADASRLSWTPTCTCPNRGTGRPTALPRRGIPDEVVYAAKWRIALDQLLSLHQNGVRFDWLVFDEGLRQQGAVSDDPDLARQRFVPKCRCRLPCKPASGAANVPSRPVAVGAGLPVTADATDCDVRTRRTNWWRRRPVPVRVAEQEYTLIVAINEGRPK